MKIGITGQFGFIGNHLYNYLNLQDDVELINFERSYFSDSQKLDEFVSQVDVVVHLAAKNRAENEQEIYDTNVELVMKLISACERKEVIPHVLFSSSTQEGRDNLYGKSKKKGRELLEAWADKNGAVVTSMVIPNVFGPFGRPNYNSVVATFCHKVTHGEIPTIISDGVIKLIYINELIDDVYQLVKAKTIGKVELEPRHEISVSQLLEKLMLFKKLYIENGEIPNLDSSFDLALFNTFRCYVPNDHFPVKFTKHTDSRGSFVEILRANSKGQNSYSTTVPGITRGNHFHTRKVERFSVISGRASIELRRIGTGDVIRYELDGDSPSYVDMPIWHTHNITNIGDTELVTLFWINEAYDSKDADTYYEDVKDSLVNKK